ncbi:hypothetical protein [Streptomyces arenae]|uniref:hypothetical protein n=1 Tax=Streptomyces arenae TaxID=29301 RepID=UPI00265A2581|nr:hypothetical protein [Streptomyces arenae]MCG7204936.1 hypothetical protein [Streptomyces arenae]
MKAVCRHTGRDPFPAQVLVEGNRITAVAERADAMTCEVRAPTSCSTPCARTSARRDWWS